MATPREVIAKLERIRDRLQKPSEFYERVREPWLELLRRVTEHTLTALKPGDIAPDLWQQKAREIASRVTSEPQEFGLIFSLSPRLEVIDLAKIDEPQNFRLGNLAIADVEQWVAEGRTKASPDAPGKNLDERDVGKSDLQIAWRIMYALKLQKPGWDRLLDVLRQYVGVDAVDAAEALYPELLKAWLEHFQSRAPADWQRYVREVVSA